MIEIREARDPVSGLVVEIRNDLTKRLRRQYASGPTMANGEPEFGWRDFGTPPPIQIEAAEKIESLLAEIEVLKQEAQDTRALVLELYSATTGPAVMRARD